MHYKRFQLKPTINICDQICKKGLIRAIKITEKSQILITVYLENAWCLLYEILLQSIVIQGNLAGTLFNGLLAASFFISITSDYVGVNHEIVAKTHFVKLHSLYGSNGA